MPEQNFEDNPEIREFIVRVVMEKVSQGREEREEALNEFFAVSMPNIDQQAATKVANLVPPLMDGLYTKWAGMFVDRLFETVPMTQLEYLADGETENKAALALAFIMFMESERMELQIAEDLSKYANEQSGEAMGDLAAEYIRAKMTSLAGEIKNTDKKMN